MKCGTHKDSEAQYQCKTCGVPLCRECKPVSFRGKIYCPSCSESEEKALFVSEEKKARIRSFKIRETLMIAFLFLFCASLYYYLFLKPREIRIPADDRDRLRYYLNLAYEKKSPETYNRQMDNILRINDDYRNVISFLKAGESKLDKLHYAEALKDFEKVKKMLPDWEWIYIFSAKCYAGMNKKDEAEEELKEAQELNPDGSRAYTMLGELYASEGDIEQAILQYSKALFIDSKNCDVMLNLAELYYRKNSRIKAQEFRDEARKLGANTQKIDDLLHSHT